MSLFVGGKEIVETERYKWRVLAATCLGRGFDAVDFLVLSLGIPLLIKDLGLTLVEAGAVASATMFGAALSSFFWGPIADRFGRRHALALILAWFAVWTLACGFAQNYTQLLVFRFICGLGLGGVWPLLAAYFTEFFPAHQRGTASAVTESFWAIGYGVAIGIQWLFVPIWGWRGLFYGGTLAILATVYIYLFVPESPSWIQSKIDKAKAKVAEVVEEKKESSSFSTLFKGANLKATLLASLLCISLLTAYWGSATWIPAYLAQEKGQNVKEMSGYLLAFNFFGFVGYYLYGWFADRYGRRWNFMLGCLIAAVATIVWINQTSAQAVFWVGMFYALMSYGVYGPWMAFVAEQFPDVRTRATGAAFAYGCARVATVLIPIVLAAVATKTNLGIAIGVVAVLFVIGAITAYFMKETEDVQAHFAAKKAANNTSNS